MNRNIMLLSDDDAFRLAFQKTLLVEKCHLDIVDCQNVDLRVYSACEPSCVVIDFSSFAMPEEIEDMLERMKSARPEGDYRLLGILEDQADLPAELISRFQAFLRKSFHPLELNSTIRNLLALRVNRMNWRQHRKELTTIRDENRHLGKLIGKLLEERTEGAFASIPEMNRVGKELRRINDELEEKISGGNAEWDKLVKEELEKRKSDKK